MDTKEVNLFIKKLILDRNLAATIINRSIYEGKQVVNNEELVDLNIPLIKKAINALFSVEQNFELIGKRFKNQIYLMFIAESIDDIDPDISLLYQQICYQTILDIDANDTFKEANLYAMQLLYGHKINPHKYN